MQERDYTQLSLFTMCPAKFNYVYRLCLDHTVGNAAHFSSELIHPAISAWYAGMADHLDWDAMWKRYSEVAPQPESELYTMDRAKTILAQYREQFAGDLTEYELVATEVAGSVLITGGQWISKPDLVLREVATGEVGVIDIKSSKYDINAELIPVDRQFLGQVRIIDAKWMMKAHAQLLKKETRLTRSWCKVMPDLVREWELEMEMVYGWIDQCEATGVWPKHAPGACTAFFQTCEFLELCQAGQLRDQMVQQWKKVNPTAYLTQ